MDFWKYSRNNTYIGLPGKLSEINFYVLLVPNPGEKVVKSIKSRGKSVPYFKEGKLPFPFLWITTMQVNGFWTIFQECWHMCSSWKVVRNLSACMVVLQSTRKGPNNCWNFMQSVSATYETALTAQCNWQANCYTRLVWSVYCIIWRE